MAGTAVLIYHEFCYFEISVALEALALGGREVTVFAKELHGIKSEEGMTVLPDKCIADIVIEEYDSLLLPGAADIGEAVRDEEILSFIRLFAGHKKIIGAISIAPVLLVKCGVLAGLPFMAGTDREELYEEGFTKQELALMQGWTDNLKNPVKNGYLVSENIITSVSYEFARFGLAFAGLLGIAIPPETFGVRDAVTYRQIVEAELSVELFAHFNRHQVVTKCWRKRDGEWGIEDAPFIDDWSREEYETLTACLKNTVVGGGFVCGAFAEGKLKGFVSVEAEFFGKKKEYLDLTAIHVSEEMRGAGIGRKLFQEAKRWAKEKGAGKLYISAHSAVESQAFYKNMGCIWAAECNEAHVEKEPFDCQLEYIL